MEKQNKMAISLFIRFVIIITIVVSATDTIVFYHLQKQGMEYLTWQLVILTIIITIIPIVINLWWWLVFKKKEKEVRNSSQPVKGRVSL